MSAGTFVLPISWWSSVRGVEKKLLNKWSDLSRQQNCYKTVLERAFCWQIFVLKPVNLLSNVKLLAISSTYSVSVPAKHFWTLSNSAPWKAAKIFSRGPTIPPFVPQALAEARSVQFHGGEGTNCEQIRGIGKGLENPIVTSICYFAIIISFWWIGRLKWCRWI